MFSASEELCVGLKGGETDLRLVRLAGALAGGTGMKPELVHVFEGSFARYGATTLAFEAMLPVPLDAANAQKVDDERRGAANAHVDAMLDHLEAPSLRKNGVVLDGDVVESLFEHCREHNVGMLLIGTHSQSGPGARTLSNAIGLMAQMPVPVLTVPEDATGLGRLAEPGARILVADDLTPQSEPALSAAVRLAAACQARELIVAHVHRARSGGAVAQYFAAYAHAVGTDPRYLDTEADDSPAELERRALIARLTQRLRAAGADDVSGLIVGWRLLDGEPVAALAAEAATIDADLVVFGRHRLLHRRWPPLGRVTYEAMLSLRRPVMVVPEPPPPLPAARH
jgi:nucleotide-binding universal stress UspA family protein